MFAHASKVNCPSARLHALLTTVASHVIGSSPAFSAGVDTTLRVRAKINQVFAECVFVKLNNPTDPIVRYLIRYSWGQK